MPRQAAAEVDVHIGIDIPAPPAIVFDHEPRVVVVPRTDVYYVPDVSGYDMFRYGSWWYVNRDGYWYRARHYSGPFSFVPYDRVPNRVIGVPKHYHRHPVRPHRHRHVRDRHDHDRGHHRRHDRHDRRDRHDRHDRRDQHDRHDRKDRDRRGRHD